MGEDTERSAGPELGELHLWRHPKPIGAAGRCIGRTDLPVDPRKAKRLAHRIRQHARRQALPREVFTSPLRRSADVGRWLARWGWQHRVDEALSEIDFGHWDGQRWDDIGEPAVTAWCADFAHHAGHEGESVSMLFDRCTAWLGDARGPSTVCIVTHAGWINAARAVLDGRGLPRAANEWVAPLAYGRMLRMRRDAMPTEL